MAKNKFMGLMTATGDQSLVKRSGIIEKGLESEAAKAIQVFTDRINEIDLEVIQLEDLGTSTTFDTKPAQIDPKEWWAKRFNLKKERELLQIELKLARELRDEYLGEIIEGDEHLVKTGQPE